MSRSKLEMLQELIELSWLKPNALTVLLWPVSIVYRGLFALRSCLYHWGLLASYRAPVPVVVVGNLTVGGTGKTPLVIYVVQALRQQGYKPGVISRGYHSQAPSYPYFVSPDSPPTHAGDEPTLIVKRTQVPMVIGPNRQAAIEALLQQADIDIVISDDGLQHLAMQRDIELCVIDNTSLQNNAQLFPAGPYREPKTRLTSVDLIVEHGASADGVVGNRVPSFAMNLSAAAPQPLIPGNNREFDPTQPIHALAGIGNPQRFFKTCQELAYDITPHIFADHHAFSQADIDFSGQVLMTEKDAVKCTEIADSRHWYLPVNATLSAKFNAALLEKVAHFTSTKRKTDDGQ